MQISFEKIEIGSTYSRPQLAKLWGYAGYQALARGVVTPQNDNKIILFVTFDKPEYIEQYKDELKGSILHWEGPTDHFAESRMINAERTGDQIHVFYRERHHSDFVYEGKYIITSYAINSNRPSKFVLNRA
jgi:putative restriction endonuclease